MACFPVVFVAFSILLRSVCGQAVATCDQFNTCLNGVCELQTNQQPGCTCNPGFILDPVSPLHCHPIPSCNLLQGSPDQQCLNGICQQLTSGAFGCMCYSGYQQSMVNPNICENVDECTLPYTGCAPGACTDVIGDYSCTACMGGYTLDRRGKCQRLGMYHGNQGNQVNQATSGHNDASPWMWPLMMDGMFF